MQYVARDKTKRSTALDSWREQKPRSTTLWRDIKPKDTSLDVSRHWTEKNGKNGTARCSSHWMDQDLNL